MRNFITNHKRLTIFAAVLIVVFAGYWLLSRPAETGFRVVKTNPDLGKVTYLAPFLKLEFSEPITYDKVSIADQGVVKSYITSQKTLTIFLALTPDQIGKDVTVTVASVTSTIGSKLTNQKYTFEVKEGEWSTLPKDQQEAVLNEQDKKPATYNDPILVSLPHETPTYKLTAVVSNEGRNTKLSLHADITPVFADTLSDGSVPQEIIDQYKQEVIDYIRSLDLDPAKYPIDYTIVNPYRQNPTP